MSKSKTQIVKGWSSKQKAKIRSMAKKGIPQDKIGKIFHTRKENIGHYLRSVSVGKRAVTSWSAEAKAYGKAEGISAKAAKKHILAGRGYTERRAKKGKGARKVSVTVKKTRYGQDPTMWQLCIIVDMKDEATGETRDGIEGYSKAHSQKNFSASFDEAVNDAQATAGGSNWYITNVVSTEWIHYI
jgi:hypothetical protein